MPTTTSRRLIRTPTGLRPWAFAFAALTLLGCGGKPKDFDNENDALRRKVLDLETRVSSLSAENGELAAKIAELTRERDVMVEGSSVSAEVIESLPRCAAIEFARYSGPADRDGTPGIDVIEVFVRPFDGRRRFVQVAGRLTVSAVLLPPSSDGQTPQPQLLGSVTLGPRELREAYRSGPLGTHYSVSIPLDPPNQILNGTVVISAELDDAVTGVVHRTTQPVG
jgi:hypothetical protein